MTQRTSPPEGELARLIDEQVELAVTRLPALAPGLAHPSPIDHDELATPHADFEAVLLGTQAATPDMVAEFRALQQTTSPLSEEELAQQALAAGGADGNPSTAE